MLRLTPAQKNMIQRSRTRLRILWPGKTRSPEWRALQESYLARIRRLEPCELVEVKEAAGLDDREAEKIMQIEAKNLEKHLRDDYIICLLDRGNEMNSGDLARFIGERIESPGRRLSSSGGSPACQRASWKEPISVSLFPG